MTNLVRAAKEQAARLVQDAYEAAAVQGQLPAGREVRGAVEAPKDRAKGDFASSFAVSGARVLGMEPRRAAGILLERLKLEGSFFERAELGGPGYLNFFCAPCWYGEVLAAVEGLSPVPSPVGRPLPVPPVPIAEVRRQAWEDALGNLLRREGMKIPPVQGVGPVVLLREGRPIPSGGWVGVGQDALRYFLTSRPAGRPVELDVDLAAREDGGNPLYYVRYTHARICALIARMGAAGAEVCPAGQVDACALAQPEEVAMVKTLAQYPEEIRLAARDYDPSRINRYLTTLAGDLRRFYNACCGMVEDPCLQAARLKLANCTRLVLANGLGLLGVDAPNEM